MKLLKMNITILNLSRKGGEGPVGQSTEYISVWSVKFPLRRVTVSACVWTPNLGLSKVENLFEILAARICFDPL